MLNCNIVGEDERRALLFGVGANQKTSSSQVVVSVAEDRQPDSQPPPSPHARCRVLPFPSIALESPTCLLALITVDFAVVLMDINLLASRVENR